MLSFFSFLGFFGEVLLPSLSSSGLVSPYFVLLEKLFDLSESSLSGLNDLNDVADRPVYGFIGIPLEIPLGILSPSRRFFNLPNP